VQNRWVAGHVMQKKYQVFISATYRDLIEERQAVMKAILDLGHIPSGMELFSAADEEQFSYIKRIIDECDYYVLVIGWRYGSLDADGLGYTEKEYDYAFSKSIPVLAFLHQDINSSQYGNVDQDQMNRERLESFRKKVSERRLVKFWRDKENLESQVIISLTKAFNEMPRVGWVRAADTSNEELLSEINRLRNNIDKLNVENRELKDNVVVNIVDISWLKDYFNVHFYYLFPSQFEQPIPQSKVIKLSWQEIWSMLGPSTFTPIPVGSIGPILIPRITEYMGRNGGGYLEITSIHMTDIDKIKMQFFSFAFMEICDEGIIITDTGKRAISEYLLESKIAVGRGEA
jgi:hypothetical protein